MCGSYIKHLLGCMLKYSTFYIHFSVNIPLPLIYLYRGTFLFLHYFFRKERRQKCFICCSFTLDTICCMSKLKLLKSGRSALAVVGL